jgi:hypothetical protein
MDAAFWLKLGLSFLVGSGWVAWSTVAAEKYGSRIGGLIGGLPSTVFVSLLFIGLTQNPAAASETTTLMPLAQGINGVFIAAYLFFVRRGLASGLLNAFWIWLILTAILAVAGIRQFAASVCGWALLVVGCYFAVERGMNIASRSGLRVRYTTAQIAGRALFGGAVIAFAVWMGKLLGPVYGGIFATFPAMFVSTLAITYRAGGPQFSRAVGKSMMMSGMVNVALYAIAVRYCYQWSGLVFGTILAVAFSCGTGYITYLFIKARVA